MNTDTHNENKIKYINVNGSNIDQRLINRIENIDDPKNKQSKPFFYPPSLKYRIDIIHEHSS